MVSLSGSVRETNCPQGTFVMEYTAEFNIQNDPVARSGINALILQTISPDSTQDSGVAREKDHHTGGVKQFEFS